MKKINRSRFFSNQVPYWSDASDYLDYSFQQGIDHFQRRTGIELTRAEYMSYLFSCRQMSDAEFIMRLAKLENEKKKTDRDNVLKLKKDIGALAKRNKRLYGQEKEKAKSRKKVKKLLQRITV